MTWTTSPNGGPELIEVDSAALGSIPEPSSLLMLSLSIPAIGIVVRDRLRSIA